MRDFYASVSEGMLNATSLSLFPSIRSMLTRSSFYDGIIVTWTITEAPRFDLSNPQGGSNFQVVLAIDIDAGSGHAFVETIGNCALAISGNGDLSVDLNDLSFMTNDQVLSPVLRAKKTEIMFAVDQVLDLIKVPIGPIEGVTFNRYHCDISHHAINVGGDILPWQLPIPDASSVGPASYGFRIGISQALIVSVINNLWWEPLDKTFRPNRDVVIHLNNYSLDVTDNSFGISLDTSGDVYVGPSGAEAHWGISISTIHIGLNISVDENRNVSLTAGSVNTPDVSISPKNFLAHVESIGIGEIINFILSEVIAGKIPDGIRDALKDFQYTVPSISETFQGVSVNITPTDLRASVMNRQILVTGQANVNVS